MTHVCSPRCYQLQAIERARVRADNRLAFAVIFVFAVMRPYFDCIRNGWRTLRALLGS